MAEAMRVDAQANVAKILDSARRAFAGQDGGGTLASIARGAGVGAATLYRHFPSREALAQAVFDRAVRAELEPLIVAIADTGASRPLLLDLAERLLALLRREHELVRSVGDIAKATARALAPSRDAITDAVHRATAIGVLRPDLRDDDVPVLLTMLAAGFAAIPDEPSLRRRYLGLVFDALKPGEAEVLPG